MKKRENRGLVSEAAASSSICVSAHTHTTTYVGMCICVCMYTYKQTRTRTHMDMCLAWMCNSSAASFFFFLLNHHYLPQRKSLNRLPIKHSGTAEVKCVMEEYSSQFAWQKHESVLSGLMDPRRETKSILPPGEADVKCYIIRFLFNFYLLFSLARGVGAHLRLICFDQTRCKTCPESSLKGMRLIWTIFWCHR